MTTSQEYWYFEDVLEIIQIYYIRDHSQSIFLCNTYDCTKDETLMLNNTSTKTTMMINNISIHKWIWAIVQFHEKSCNASSSDYPELNNKGRTDCRYCAFIVIDIILWI